MNRKKGTFLGYKVCRRKFFATSTVIVLLFLAVFSGCIYFFTLNWMNQQYTEALNNFSAIERRVGTVKEYVDEFVTDLYGSRRMMQDAQSLYEATNEMEYISNRGVISKATAAQIVYLPSEMKKLFLNNRVKINGITIESDAGIKAIWLDKISGDVHITYGLDSEWEASSMLAEFGDLPIQKVRISYPDSIVQNMGTMTFWVDREEIFACESVFPGGYVVLQNEEVMLSHMPSYIKEELPALIWEKEEGKGIIQEGIRQRIYYTKSDFTQYDAAFITAVSITSLWSANSRVLLVLLLALGGMAVGAILTTYAGVREDVRFLSCIMQMFAAMEKGDFTVADQMEGGLLHSRNEYGAIAADLKEVSRKLSGYIRTEYILKLKQQETAMRALQQQINPHFLYNTLETIRSRALMRNDLETASAIEHLGGLFRARVHSPDIITLKEEFELLRMYLHIMELRFAEKFVYQMVLDSEVEMVNTINFWMQPLAENFFTHGFDTESEFNLLLIEGSKEGDYVKITIIDNGKGMTDERLLSVRRHMYEGSDDPKADIGIRNVYMRLSWYYGDAFEMDIMHAEEGGTQLQIWIPLERAEEMLEKETM